MWVTESKGAAHRGDAQIAPRSRKPVARRPAADNDSDGVVRGKPPKFFDGNAQAFSGLRFHLERDLRVLPAAEDAERSALDRSDCIDAQGPRRSGGAHCAPEPDPGLVAHLGKYIGRLGQLPGMVEVDLHVEEVTGADKSLDVVVDLQPREQRRHEAIQGDLALAKIGAEWPEARQTMKQALAIWAVSGYHFCCSGTHRLACGAASPGSTETLIDQDLASLVGEGDPLDRLLERLRLWHGGLHVEGGHLSGWTRRAFLPRPLHAHAHGQAEDWGTG